MNQTKSICDSFLVARFIVRNHTYPYVPVRTRSLNAIIWFFSTYHDIFHYLIFAINTIWNHFTYFGYGYVYYTSIKYVSIDADSSRLVQIWLDLLGQVGTSRDKSGQVGTSWDKSGQVWTSRDKSGLV